MRTRAIELSRSPAPRFLGWWQLRVCGLRVHHGAVGAAVCLSALFPVPHRYRLGLAALGALLVTDDWADRPWLP